MIGEVGVRPGPRGFHTPGPPWGILANVKQIFGNF